MENRILNLLLLSGRCSNCPLDEYCSNKIQNHSQTVCEALDKNIEVKDDEVLQSFLAE